MFPHRIVLFHNACMFSILPCYTHVADQKFHEMVFYSTIELRLTIYFVDYLVWTAADWDGWTSATKGQSGANWSRTTEVKRDQLDEPEWLPMLCMSFRGQIIPPKGIFSLKSCPFLNNINSLSNSSKTQMNELEPWAYLKPSLNFSWDLALNSRCENRTNGRQITMAGEKIGPLIFVHEQHLICLHFGGLQDCWERRRRRRIGGNSWRRCWRTPSAMPKSCRER